MRLLLTAFEPFDTTGLNSSLEACRLFLRRWGDEWDLVYRVLPVRYGADTEAVEMTLAESRCDLLLHTGQATGAREVRVERLAVNVRYPEDLAEMGPAQRPIDPHGPAALFSTLPVDAVAAAIRAAGVPAAVSNHAGIYLCNHVLYRSVQRSGPEGPRAGFLHLPCLPEQAAPGQPSLAAEQGAAAIRAALACLRDSPSRAPFLEL